VQEIHCLDTKVVQDGNQILIQRSPQSYETLFFLAVFAALREVFLIFQNILSVID